MTDRASVFQGIQIGVETSGSAAANKLLESLSITPAAKADIAKYDVQGTKYSGLTAIGKEWSEAKLSGPATYSEILYPLSGLINAPSGSSLGSSAYGWTFESANAAADSVKTYSIEQGSSVRAHQMSGAQMTGLKFTYNRNEVTIDGSMFGKALVDGITMTSTPTAIELKPVLPSQVSVYLDTTAAGLGGTLLTRVLGCTWELADKFNPLWVLNAAESSYSASIEAKPKLTATLKVEADATGMGLLAQMRSGDTRFLRIEAVGALIGGAIYYKLSIDTAVKITNISEFSDEDGVFAIEWTFDGVYDATWTKAFSIYVVNKLSAL